LRSSGSSGDALARHDGRQVGTGHHQRGKHEYATRKPSTPNNPAAGNRSPRRIGSCFPCGRCRRLTDPEAYWARRPRSRPAHASLSMRTTPLRKRSPAAENPGPPERPRRPRCRTVTAHRVGKTDLVFSGRRAFTERPRSIVLPSGSGLHGRDLCGRNPATIRWRSDLFLQHVNRSSVPDPALPDSTPLHPVQ